MSYVHLCITPTPDQWFRVIPHSIDRNLFEEMRKDARQELVRKMILLAFTHVDRYPKTFGTFYTTYPKKKWDKMRVRDMERMAEQIGEGVATITHQALEWAQRIANGEKWETLCNKPDEANYYRLAKWYVGTGLKQVGGAKAVRDDSPAVDVYHPTHCQEEVLCDCVPLIINHF